jgi:DNA-binding transcriptional LysR family regulator
MSLYTYRIFYTVVKERSFSRAAEQLNLSPSAVSHAVAKLEEEFGFPLLVRARRAVTLSDSGAQVFAYIQDLLNISDLLDKRVSQIKGAGFGTVRLGLIDSVAVKWLPGIMAAYRALCPEVRVQARENTYDKLIAAVTARELDMAIVSHSSIRAVSAPLQFIPLYEDRLLCVSPKGFTPRNPGFITPEELDGLDLILPLGGNEADVNTYLESQGLHLKEYCSAITNSSLVSMVRSGFGHAVDATLSFYSAGDLEDLNVLPIVPFGSRTLGIITHDPRFLTPAARQMVASIQDYVSSLAGIVAPQGSAD